MGIRSWLQSRLTPDEEDLREEIRAHLAIAAEERIAEGADRQEARYAALREFGNVTLTTEATRRVWTPRWMDNLRDLMSDVRYGIRALAKNPVFSLTVVAVLAIGIGLNAAVFTMLKGIVLSPLAGVDGAARLAVLHGETSAGRPVRLSYPDYRDLRDHDRAFSGLLGSIVAKVNLGRGRGARQIWGEFVTGNYFQVLGVRAELGRTLEPSDEVAPGKHPVVVLSEGLWRRDFGADPNIIGRTVEINNLHLTVVGVADRAFHGTTVVYDVEAFIPVMMAPDLGFTFGSDRATPAGILSDRAAGLFFPHGYLRPGTTLEEAAAQSGALWERLAEDRPITAPAAERLKVVPFAQVPSGAPSFMMPTLGVLGAMGLLVLAIACANIAGLVLVRGVSRRGEIAVRLALGASRARIVRLLVVENLALAAPGAALGVLLAHYGIPVLAGYAQWLAAPLRIHFNTDVDGLVIGFTVLVACTSVLLFGFVPALSSSRVDLVSTINEDASPRGAARGRFRSALVVAQVAVSLLLLVGAGLAARSVDAARRAHPGFDAGNLTAVAFDLRQNGYDERRGRVFSRRLLAAVRSDPSIEGATLAAHVPLNMTDTRADRLTLEGHDARTGDDVAFMSNAVAPDYFRTLRIPVLAGREFESSDDEEALPVVMVNDTMARRFWGDPASAVGQRVRVGSGDWRTVIGVAGDVKYSRMDEAPRPYFYLPLLQAYRSNLTLHARGHAGQSGDPAAVHRHVDIVRAHMTRLDPELPIMSARPMTEAAGGAFIFLDLTAMMLFIFGVAGMALAAMGTYGLVSYTVKQSTHEIAIRMALGASGSSVVRQFLRRGLRLGAGGAALGVATALAAAGLLERVLFGVSPTDAVTILIALAIVFGVVALATVIPAWRAARTSPLCALRHH